MAWHAISKSPPKETFMLLNIILTFGCKIFLRLGKNLTSQVPAVGHDDVKKKLDTEQIRVTCPSHPGSNEAILGNPCPCG